MDLNNKITDMQQEPKIKDFNYLTDFVKAHKKWAGIEQPIYHPDDDSTELKDAIRYMQEIKLNKGNELEELRAWKESAMAVMPDYQRIGKLIGVPLGQSVHDKIIPFLEKLADKECAGNNEAAQHCLNLILSKRYETYTPALRQEVVKVEDVINAFEQYLKVKPDEISF